jgi:hypothetical protein
LVGSFKKITGKSKKWKDKNVKNKWKCYD